MKRCSLKSFIFGGNHNFCFNRGGSGKETILYEINYLKVPSGELITSTVSVSIRVLNYSINSWILFDSIKSHGLGFGNCRQKLGYVLNIYRRLKIFATYRF